MAEFLFSSHWYRVANLHPRLRSHVRVTRQRYRDQLWFLLQDQTSGRHHRVNEIAYQFVGRMDGTRTVQEIWDVLLEDHGENAPSQDETIQILCQLSEVDLLQCETTPDVVELFRRRDERTSKRRQSMINPLAFRVPLVNPTVFLDRCIPVVRMLFQPLWLVACLTLIAFATITAFSNWPILRAEANTVMLLPRYLLLMWICYPFIKLIHELGHAFAVRAWGGQVHELGVTLFLLIPVPYVDASASGAFREKYQRMAVAGMGILVELVLAAIGTLIWFNVEAGWVRDIALVTMVIGGVSTLLFNGNPLLKFDGYYVLADALDIPNLAQRSRAYFFYIVQKYLLQIRDVISPTTTASESAWLLGYGAMSWCYRLSVTLLIIFWVSGKSALLGFAAAIWLLISMVMTPAVSGFRFLLHSSKLGAKRLRKGLIVGAALTTALLALWWVPLPMATNAVGVVWLPEKAHIRSASDAFIDDIFVKDGQVVKAGEVLMKLSDPSLQVQRKELMAKLAMLEVEYQSAMATSPTKAQSLLEEKSRLLGDLAEVSTRIAGLTVQSPVAGRFVMTRAQDVLHTYAPKGTLLAHVLTADRMQVRVAVAQDDVSLVRTNTQSTEIFLKEIQHKPLSARLVREVPAGLHELPSAALADRFGGMIATDPADPKALRTLEPVFLFDIEVPAARTQRVGGRAWVRFDHGSEPLSGRIYRSLQRLLLRHFSDAK